MATLGPIYKVNHLIDDDTIGTIYVFFGMNVDIAGDPQELFDRDPSNEAFRDVFSRDELATILDTANNIRVKFSTQQIHYDDTISSIKQKIAIEFGHSISLEEIYLFCLKEELLNSENVFQTLTQNGKYKLTKAALDSFLLNIKRDENGRPITIALPESDKGADDYGYDDILALDINDKKFWIAKVLGQKYFISSNDYPFVSNPYNISEYDRFIERASTKSLTTLNSNLLLNTGQIMGNNIYLCTAQEVVTSASEKDINESYIIKLYYPVLSRKFNINSLEELESQRETLIEGNSRLLSPAVMETFKSVDLFYDVYKFSNPTKSVKYKNSGIKYIKVAMRPLYKIKIPLDVIFKLIHATELNPLIKFNPASRKENVYRLYANRLAVDGRKIPYLPKSKIFKLEREIGKSKSVAVYITQEFNGNTYSLVCEFEENGNIVVSCDFEKIMDIAGVTELLKLAVNPIISYVKNYLEQSGYKINLFESLYDENVDVKLLNYQAVIGVENMFNITDSITGCLTSVFVIESKDLQKPRGIEMRFKRVSNFNQMTSQEAFVIEQQKKGVRGADSFIQALIENYKMTETEARELINKMANELQVERGKDIEIKVNPGFKTTIKTNNTLLSVNNNITISVEDIDDISYLDTIPIYLDSFIRLTQKNSGTRVPLNSIRAICSSTRSKEDIIMEDTISSAEDSLSNTTETPVSDDELVVGQPVNEEEENEKIDFLLGFNDDDDSNEYSSNSEKSVIGGQSTSSEGEILGSDEIQEGEILGSDEIQEGPGPVSVPLKEKKEKKVKKDKEEKKEKKEKKDKEEKKEVEQDIRNIDGMLLTNNSNPFVNRIKEHDPQVLVHQNPDGTYESYSRACSSSTRQQPVLVTDEELEQIRKDNPGFLQEGDVLKYGSEPDNQFNYICPKYWCLKTQTPLTDEEIDAGACGGRDSLIPKNAKVVPKGKYIYVFFAPTQHGKSIKKEDYKKNYPGFVTNSCLPCCYRKWSTREQTERREMCAAKVKKNEQEFGDVDEERQELLVTPSPRATAITPTIPAIPTIPATPATPATPGIKKQEKDDYVKGPDKYPLEMNRWGYLPMSIQLFLRESSVACQISKSNTNIKPNHTCLLRHGVEKSVNQSFIACIADAIFYGKSEIPSIDEMKEMIIGAIDIDSFVTFQNGNLIETFTTEKMNTERAAIDGVDISDYTTGIIKSKIYNKIKRTSDERKRNEKILFFKKLVAAFDNFKSFLRDKNETIDYRYLWDIISRPNAKLFPEGRNLIILDIPDNDTTNNVEIICPTNHYSSEFFEARKPSLFILKHETYYEPIYAYHVNNKGKISVLTQFSEYGKISSSMNAIFKKIIKPILRSKCGPLASMPNEYRFKSPILLSKLIVTLNKLNYKILKQVVNFQGRVISLIVVNPLTKLTGYVPCYPASLDESLDYVYMNDDNLFNTYSKTIAFLKALYKDSKEEIPCKPTFQIVEDDHVVGFLTLSNQFVQINNPMLSISPEIDTSIKTMNNNNYFIADEETSISYNVDEERVDYIKRIKLETNFFNVFRNTIRILLNKYAYLKLREKIEKEINLPYMLYNVKLKRVISYLKELVGNSILFSDAFDYKTLGTSEISTCIVVPNDKCDTKNPVCAMNDENMCQLIIPKQNLITNNDNEIYYFGRMADELIRYNRIKTFIFQPQSYLLFGTLEYNLREDEIIVIQSLLTSEYFDGLIPMPINKYVKYNTYDNAEPNISQVYDNSNEEHEEIECEPISSIHISSGEWKPYFPSNFTELKYENSPNCGFNLIIDIIQRFSGTAITFEQVKLELYDEYSRFLPDYEKQILDILIKEGKKTLSNQVKSKTLSFRHFILANDYFITNLDLCLLLRRHKVPSILISGKSILETMNTTNIFAVYGSTEDNFVFIMVPPPRPEHVPSYKLIQSGAPEKGIFFNTSILTTEEYVVNAIENKVDIGEFIRTFIKPKAKYYAPVRKFIIEEEVEPVVEEEEEERVELANEKIEIEPEHVHSHSHSHSSPKTTSKKHHKSKHHKSKQNKTKKQPKKTAKKEETFLQISPDSIESFVLA